MRLIDADSMKADLLTVDPQYEGMIQWCITVLDAQPTIERKTGRWTVGSDMPPMKHRNGKPKKFWPSLRYCSVCGHEAYDDSDWGETLFDWCPYCGADMRGEGHE